MHERIEAIVSGRVQMVMYRDFACRKARGLKLCGEVKNLPNGTVRVIAEGPTDTLDRYIVRLNEGSVLSKVDHVLVARLPATGEYTRFDIAYD